MPLRPFVNLGDDDRALRRLLLAAMALGFVALAIGGYATFQSTERAQTYSRTVERTYQAIAKMDALQVAFERSETARRGYLLSGQTIFEQGYVTNSAVLASALEEVGHFTIDNQVQRANVAKAERTLRSLQLERERSMDRLRSGQVEQALVEFQHDRAVPLMRALRARIAAMIGEEQRLLVVRGNEQARATQIFYATLGGTAVIAMIVALLSLFTVLRFVRDLGASRARLEELNVGLEDAVTERTADLSRANEEIQRFAYIVSHDLRSPLVNVMGFTAELETSAKSLAELIERADELAPDIVTEEARYAVREDLPEAIGFIRTSTAKMDRLINAILKLSREGRRTIAPEPLDMTALVKNVRDTLAQQLEARGAELVIEPLPEITNDRIAIDQVFANVIENAVKYLDSARPGRIVVRGRTEHGRALFEIEDNGRGIDPKDHARVFDLFRRSGTQDQPGEGIGLAHVRALTYRLGGTIDVASALGEGATFRISLPIHYSELSGSSS